MTPLTERVLHYQATGEGLKEIEDSLAMQIYRFPLTKARMDEDACGEFYLYFYPRLLRLLDRFQDQGKPFEAYLFSIMEWQLKNFLNSRTQQERSWNTSLRLDPGDGYSQPETEAGEETVALDTATATETAKLLKTKADRRNFLLLLLKCPATITSQNASTLAHPAGLPPGRLLSLTDTLQGMREARQERLENFRARRNKAFTQVCMVETSLQHEVDTNRRMSLQADLARAKRRMSNATRRMSKVALSPSNREIGAVLGVPKGTIDSGLYWIKRKLHVLTRAQGCA
jgi:DNA-directed RNA polymerase specialized sigma24 family protein